MSEEWNLGDGLENVCDSVMRKLRYASHQLEERERTIINMDSYENMIREVGYNWNFCPYCGTMMEN